MIPFERLKIAQLRELLHEMERDAGLHELSTVERAILSAMDTLSTRKTCNAVSTEELRSHVLLTDVAQATFYRALNSLKSREFIEVAPNRRAKSYVLKR